MGPCLLSRELVPAVAVPLCAQRLSPQHGGGQDKPPCWLRLSASHSSIECPWHHSPAKYSVLPCPRTGEAEGSCCCGADPAELGSSVLWWSEAASSSLQAPIPKLLGF